MIYKDKLLASTLIIVLLAAMALPAAAQELDPKISFWGVFQPRISYGLSQAADDSEAESLERFGFGMRRARLRFELETFNRIGVRYDADFASGSFRSVDLFAFWRASEQVQMRIGIMPSAQPRAHIFTPIPLIDGFDRAALAEQWAAATLGGAGRDFGLDIQYQTPAWTIIGFLHNGDGSFDRQRGNFSQTISSGSATGNIERVSLATSVFVAHRFSSLPGVEVGGYLSFNPAENPNTETAAGQGRQYTSYAAHAYYGADPGSQPFRVKLDLIGIDYDDDQQFLGYSVLGAVRLVEYAEFFARYENIQQDTAFDGNDFVSAGFTFSLSKLAGGNYATQRATLGYSRMETPAGQIEGLLVFQWNFIL